MKKIYALYGDCHHDENVVKKCLKNVFGENIIVTDDPSVIPWENMKEEVLLYVSMKESNTTLKDDGTVDVWITKEREDALYEFVSLGGAALFIHNGLVGFGTDSTYHKLTGGVFIEHPPIMNVTYTPIGRPHPITEGVGKITGEDEKYFCHIDVSDVDIFFGGEDPVHAGTIAGWCKNIGNGRTAAVTPGHTFEIVDNENMIRLVKNAADWVLKKI